jgi:thioredoxin reductase/NAD-dependent dihydropyrimidine dehydrogenase PreA subunit
MGFSRFARWLHTGWPAGTVERLPEVREDGRTAVPGVFVVGDLTGIPLLKFSADTGARAVRTIVAEPDFQRGGPDDPVRDLVIVGGGVSGIAAALEAKAKGLRFTIFEASEPYNTIVNFPKAKPIYTYPTEMEPAGELRFTASVKEALLAELEEQRARAGIEPERAHVERVERRGKELVVHVAGRAEPVRARRVIIAIGRSGNYRKLGVPGENRDKVYHRLYDPRDYEGKDVLVVGGGDSALESAIALAMAGAHVTLSYRKRELARPKPENVERLEALRRDPMAEVQVENPVSERVSASMTVNIRQVAHPGSIAVLLGSQVTEIGGRDVRLVDGEGKQVTLPNDVVFAMIGREAPLDFFRRSGIPIRGEWRPATWASFAAFFLFCFFVYTWKSGGAVTTWFREHGWFPFNLPESLPGAFGKTLAITLREPGFYYSLAYTVCVVLFGAARIRRRRTPYITRQTLALMAFQILPLFLLPYFILPWAGHAGAFDSGLGKTVADHLFPAAGYGHGREYWRAFGFILAWPLFIWNFFTAKPMTWWLVIGAVQTFVIIPLIIRRWGKGAYCGWVCSCGALAETLGDTQRQKMPHGPRWNRVNFVGQGVLAFATLLFVARVIGWSSNGKAGELARAFFDRMLSNNVVLGVSLDYYHLVDIFLAGIVGVGLYFWFSGRVWCRFACPLAALMHIYARFSRFRIFADKKKCISCNVCTSVCHQGIDVMGFANKGLPMQDPECVRCSACVQSCPTGTLTFGRVGKEGLPVYDRVPASPVQMREGKTKLRVVN